MRDCHRKGRSGWAGAIALGLLLSMACNDERKPPMTPDPDMAAPVDGGTEAPAARPAAPQ